MSRRRVIPYDGIHGRFVGDGHVEDERRICLLCHVAFGNFHQNGCPEAYRDLNEERPFDEFSPGEHLIIEEISGIPYRGTGWGGFGEPVTDDEVHASAPSPDRNRYMPPPTRTLQEAIELVKSHFAAIPPKLTVASDVRTWAREHGFTLASRGRLPSEVHEAYRERHG